MSEQRFVVEVARPVPATEVDAVAALVAERLRMDAGRIRTLLDGRTGPVTRPIRADKADAIARVFADAGVEVYVVADIEAPHVTGATPADASADASANAAADDHANASADTAADAAAGSATSAQRPGAPEVASRDASLAWEPESWASPQRDPAPWASEADEEAWRRADDRYAAAGYADVSTGDAGTSGARPGDARTGEPRLGDAGHEDAGPEGAVLEGAGPGGTGPEGAPPGVLEPPGVGPEDARRVVVDAGPMDASEDEVDRLGPTERRHSVDAAFLTSTRWVPSPHESEGSTSERGLPPGAGREPVAAAARARSIDRVRDEHDRWWVPRSAAGEERLPIEPPPRERPMLRTYLLLALAVSLVVLIVLQVVSARTGGAAPSGFDVGMAAYREGNFVAARRTWEPLAEVGDARAAYYLGYMAEQGLGEAWSNTRAATLYRQAADRGLPEAQVALGALYLRGMGVDQDAQRAAELYGAAAGAGYAPAQYALGLLRFHGTGVARDFAAALAAFEAAAQGGVPEAADFLAFARYAVEGGVSGSP